MKNLGEEESIDLCLLCSNNTIIENQYLATMIPQITVAVEILALMTMFRNSSIIEDCMIMAKY